MYKHLHALWLFKQFLIEDIDYLLDVDLRGYIILCYVMEEGNLDTNLRC